jgi:GT2 family glycosyltransferase
MVRKDAIDRVGGYRPEFKHAEDLDLFLRLGEIGKLGNLPETLFY